MRAHADDPAGQQARREVGPAITDVYIKPWTRSTQAKEQLRNEALTEIFEAIPGVLDLLDERDYPWSHPLKLAWPIKPFSLSRTVSAWTIAAWTMDLSWYRDDSETGGLHRASDAYAETYVFLLATGELVMSYLLHGSEPNKQVYNPPVPKKLAYGQETRRVECVSTARTPDKANRY